MVGARWWVSLVAAVLSMGSPAGAQQLGPQDVPQVPQPGVTQPPRLRRFVTATLSDGVTATDGSVRLRLLVDAEGHVTEATVVEGLAPALDQAALEAARAFEFEPGRRDGAAVPSVITYRYRFTLGAAATPQGERTVAALRGSVRDVSNQPVAGATVALTLPAGAAREQVSDAAGDVRFELTAAGTFPVRVTAPGLRPAESTEAVREREEVRVTWRLLPEPGAAAAQRPSATPQAPTPARPADPEVTVRGRRPAREVTRQTLELQEIRRMPGSGGDALRAVQNFPGVARAITGLLLVRGTTPFDTQIFADGSLIPIIYHFFGLSSVINTELLDRIDFYPGGFSARFGRAQGGIVDVGLRSPRRDRYHGVANVNLIDASVFLEGPITRNLSFALSFRRSYVDAILGAVLSGTSVNITSLPVYWDYQALLEWRPSARDRVRLAALGSDDTFALLFDRPMDAIPRLSGSFSQAIGFHSAQLLWDHTFNARSQTRVALSLGRNAISFGAGDLFGLDVTYLQFTGRAEHQQQLTRALRLNAGLDVIAGPATVNYNGIRVPTEGQMPTPGSVVRVATSSTQGLYRPAVYAELEMTPARTLRLVPGLRLDYARDAGRGATLSPRFSFRWEFLEDTFLKGALGYFTQPPQPNQSSSQPNNAVPGTTAGNPNLGFQRAVGYALGFERVFSPLVSLSVEGFYKTLTDQVVTQTDPRQVPYLNNGAGRVYGMELLLRHRPSARFFGWVAYTLSRSERQDEPGGEYRRFQFDQTHILTVLGSYRLGRGWELGARFRFVTGNPTTPIQGAVFNGDTGTYQPVPGMPFSTRNSPFHQLDVRIDKVWTFSRWNLNLYLEVLNAYNNTNSEGVLYNYNFTQSTTVGGLPFYPNLGLRGEF
ncbi:MAG: TonB family protein [Deltaproteobacteria bacterium]|nr:TonB family protein [Deltaproteobacteria bacterium]